MLFRAEMGARATSSGDGVARTLLIVELLANAHAIAVSQR